MKVAVDGIIYQLQEKGGISRLFNEILPRMCDLDNSLHIRLFTHGQLRQRLPEHERINHCAIPESHAYLRPGKTWKPFVQGIQRILDRVMIGRGKKQIWHSTYYTMPEKWDGFFIVTVHDMIFERFPDLYKGPKFDRFRAKKRLCIQYADAVICVSQTTREELQRYYQRDLGSVYVVYHGGSTVFRKLSQKQYNEKKTIEHPFLLYIGSRTSYKNSETMFKAYSLWPQRQEVSLVVVGQPWSVDEIQCLKELGIQDKVNLLTDADDETLCRLYNQSTAFVYPSLYEGFGIPLLEAMACVLRSLLLVFLQQLRWQMTALYILNLKM